MSEQPADTHNKKYNSTCYIISRFHRQWSGQKSGGDSAVSPEFVIAGMIFHPSRVQSELLHKYIEQAFVEVTLLPARHREDVWRLTLRHAHILSAHQIGRRQRSVEMKIQSCFCACLTVEEPGELFAVAEEKLNGMITNDKFCCTRWGQLQLSWWRRPLRLRGGADPESR